MLATYKIFTDRVIQKYEGGYGWNKKDAGGPTKYGITCWDLAEHRHLKMTSMDAWAPLVQAMTLDEAEAIYATKYATGIRYNDLPAGIDTVMDDYGINSGVSRVIRVARAIVKVPGGVMDQPLLDAIKKYPSADKFITAMCTERLQFMHAIRGGTDWAEFGHGWGTRVADVQAYSLHLANGAPEPKAPDLTKVTTPKAVHQAQTAPKTAAGGTLGTAAAVHVAGYDWKVVAAVAAATLALGVAYEAWQDIKAANANKLVTLPAGV